MNKKEYIKANELNNINYDNIFCPELTPSCIDILQLLTSLYNSIHFISRLILQKTVLNYNYFKFHQ